MNPHQPETDGARADELVAYLDGELDAQATAEVERRLSDDAEYRQRLRQYQQAWDMLDHLPYAEADEQFARTTVEMVALRTTDDVERDRAATNLRRGLSIAGWVGACLAAAVVGYSLLNNHLSAPDRALLGDLPVIENVDLYVHVESVEFLRTLDREGLFVEEAAGDSVEDSAVEVQNAQ